MNQDALRKTLFNTLLLLLFCGGSTVLRAQGSTTTSTEVLRAALSDEVYQLKVGNTAFFDDAPLHLPLLEELEFRTETHEFDPRLQEYALRFKFNSRRQFKVQQQINDQEQALRFYARQEYLEELLFNRYQLLIDVWLQQQQLSLGAAQASWYRDQELILRQRIRERGARSYDDLLKLEEDQLAYRQRLRNSSQKIAQLTAVVNLWLAAPVDTLLLTDWLAPNTIEDYWNGWQQDTLILPWAVHKQRVQKELVALEYAAERAEERNRLNFLQLRYQGDDNPMFNEQFTVGAGVTLPFRSARSVKNQYLELERIEESQQEQERKNRWLLKLRAAEIKLAAQLERYAQTERELEAYQQQFSPQFLATQGVTTPELLLRAQGGIYQRQHLVLEQAHQLYQDFLEVLLLSGRLSQAPYRNWLSSGGALLE